MAEFWVLLKFSQNFTKLSQLPNYLAGYLRGIATSCKKIAFTPQKPLQCDGRHNNYLPVWQYTSHFCKKASSLQTALFVGWAAENFGLNHLYKE
jgi:hypothetical protein